MCVCVCVCTCTHGCVCHSWGLYCCEKAVTMAIMLKRKKIIWAGLQVQRLSPLSSWQEARLHIGRHIAGKEAQSHIQICREPEDSDTGPELSIWNSKAHSQWLTSSNRPTHIPARPHLLIPVKQFHFLVTKHSNIWTYEGPFLFKPL